MAEMYGTAILLANAGLSVLPLNPESNVPMNGSRGVKDATTDIELIRRWWTECPTAGLGLATGMEHDIFVLSALLGAEGIRTLFYMDDHGLEIPECSNWITPVGIDYLFSYPKDGRSVKSRTIAPGLYVKGDGDFTIVPSSYLSDLEIQLEWPDEMGSLVNVPVPAPSWLLDLVTTTSTLCGEDELPILPPRLASRFLLETAGPSRA